jgi:hypothetical protein
MTHYVGAETSQNIIKLESRISLTVERHHRIRTMLLSRTRYLQIILIRGVQASAFLLIAAIWSVMLLLVIHMTEQSIIDSILSCPPFVFSEQRGDSRSTGHRLINVARMLPLIVVVGLLPALVAILHRVCLKIAGAPLNVQLTGCIVWCCLGVAFGKFAMRVYEEPLNLRGSYQDGMLPYDTDETKGISCGACFNKYLECQQTYPDPNPVRGYGLNGYDQ